MDESAKISHILPASTQAIKLIQKEVAEDNAMQVESEQDLNEYLELSTFNPMNMARYFRPLAEMKTPPKHKTETEEIEGQQILDVEKVDEAAARFQKNNYELNSRTLLMLRSQIKPEDTAEDVLEKVLSVYSDPALADEALEFLSETATPGTLAAIKEAKEKLNAQFARQITAGRNMGVQAREFAKEGLGSPEALRTMYQDITGTQREPLKLFDELTDKFRYDKMKTAITFLLHSLGQDLKSKGPSIGRGELKRLIDEVRSLQGILNVFRFFQSRMGLVYKQFNSYGLVMPPRLDFEILAKTFIKMLAERFMNPEKIIQTAKMLGISEEVAAQIIIYTQMRDAVKQVSPRYYRNQQHRDEFLRCFVDTLDKLEDQFEEEEEKEDKEEKKDE